MEERAQAGGGRVKLAGCVVNIKERITRTGSRMAWVRLSDGSGSFEVTLFSEVLAQARDLLVPGASVIVSAELRMEADARVPQTSSTRSTPASALIACARRGVTV